MASRRPTVALIHASEASMAPATAAFAQEFPEAELWHLLDNRLVSDADRAGGLTPALRDRMTRLIQYAVDGGADAVQLSCSMYGPVAIDASDRQPVTVLASDQAMFERVSAVRPARVVVIGSLASAASDSAERLTAWLDVAGADTAVESRVVKGAADAASRGDLATLQRLLVEAAVEVATHVDLIVVAQYSLAPAQPSMSAAVTVPVLSPPHLAATTLSDALGPGS